MRQYEVSVPLDKADGVRNVFVESNRMNRVREASAYMQQGDITEDRIFLPLAHRLKVSKQIR